MKSIKIGSFGKSADLDRTLYYESSAATASVAADNSGVHYCVELKSEGRITRIYAASAEAGLRVQRILATDVSTNRIVPGEDVLGIHSVFSPAGWPRKFEGKVRVLCAPRHLIANAQGSVPNKPEIQHPFPEKPGIELIHPGIKTLYKPYQDLTEITLNKQKVTVYFKHQKNELKGLLIIAANETHAANLAISIIRKKHCRLMINEFIRGLHGIRDDAANTTSAVAQSSTTKQP